MSATRRLRKLVTRLRSGGISRVIEGLSGVAPPPELRMIHEFPESKGLQTDRQETLHLPGYSNREMAGLPRFLAGPHRIREAALLFPILLLAGAATPRAWTAVDLKPCDNHISPQKQIELGKKVAAQVYQQMPVLPDSVR